MSYPAEKHGAVIEALNEAVHLAPSFRAPTNPRELERITREIVRAALVGDRREFTTDELGLNHLAHGMDSIGDVFHRGSTESEKWAVLASRVLIRALKADVVTQVGTLVSGDGSVIRVEL